MEIEEQAARQILSAINSISLNATEVAKIIAHDHPTLQQDFMRICVAFIKIQSEKTSGIDLRNQDTVELAKKIASHLDYEDLQGSLRRV